MLGLAISLMHYSGMLATTFAPDPGSPQAGFVLDSSLMAAAVTAAAFLMVGLALIAARVDHNRSQTHRLTAALIDIMPGFFALLDPAGRFTRWNANLAALTGLGDDELRGLHASSIAVPDDRAAVDAKIQEVFARGSGSLEFGLLNKTGEVHAVNWSGRLIKYQDRDCVLAIGLDIEERRAAEARILESEDRFRTVFSSVNDGISVHDAATAAFLEVNPRLCEMFGYSRDEMLKLDPGDLSTGVPPYGREDIARVLKQVMQSDQGVTVEWHSKAKDGHTFWVEISACRRLLGAKYFLISIARDITERKRADELIAQLAHYDALTGLANRRIFVTALEQAVSRSRRNSEVFAVLYLDLDHFKDVNDTLGHPAGDLLLRAVAERLKAGLREVDTVARFGGDEFAVILANLKDASAAGSLADSIIQTLGVPFSIQGHEIRSSATIGIGVYGADAPDAETILSQADLALYRAKSEGRGTYRFFTDAMDAEIRARLSLTRELSQALDADQLFLEYQPQLNIDTGQIVGLECLLRWQHPSRGVLAPDSFIPLAESSGLIVPLGRWVMRAACRQIHQWLDAGITPPVAGINLSGVQFKRSQQLEKDIALSLAEFGVPAWRLELELTESALMAASRGPHDVLLKLRAQGHRIVIDDFGSGYSSLDYLRRFPADRIKITQTFTSGIGRTPEGDAIVRAALALAQQFRMEVVVDGVETRAQLELLRTWGCRIVQGCYFARPADAAAITALLRAGRVSPTPAEEVEASLQTLGARTRA
jgi:diguanylate cyclase (GGDEF)-like protein/PAS domain S-box-containing protein